MNKNDEIKIEDRVSNGTWLRGTVRGIEPNQYNPDTKNFIVDWDHPPISELPRYVKVSKLHGFAALPKEIHQTISRKGGKATRKNNV